MHIFVVYARMQNDYLPPKTISHCASKLAERRSPIACTQKACITENPLRVRPIQKIIFCHQNRLPIRVTLSTLHYLWIVKFNYSFNNWNTHQIEMQGETVRSPISIAPGRCDHQSPRAVHKTPRQCGHQSHKKVTAFATCEGIMSQFRGLRQSSGTVRSPIPQGKNAKWGCWHFSICKAKVCTF